MIWPTLEQPWLRTRPSWRTWTRVAPPRLRSGKPGRKHAQRSLLPWQTLLKFSMTMMRLSCLKKTLPGSSASLLQVEAGAVSRRNKALAAVRSLQKQASSNQKPGLDLLVLALTGKMSGGAGFEKVIKMIDNMVDILKKEQDDDIL